LNYHRSAISEIALQWAVWKALRANNVAQAGAPRKIEVDFSPAEAAANK
jgi:hypothetical protein